MSRFDVHQDMRSHDAAGDAALEEAMAASAQLESALAALAQLRQDPPPEPTGALAALLEDGFTPTATTDAVAPRRRDVRRRVHSVWLRLAATVMALATSFGGAAAAGALPAPWQQWVSDGAARLHALVPLRSSPEPEGPEVAPERRSVDLGERESDTPALLPPPQRPDGRDGNRVAADRPNGDASVDDARDKARDAAEEAEERREEAQRTRRDQRREAADDADERRDDARKAADDAEDAAEDHTDAVEDAEDDAADDAEDAADEAADAAEDAADDAEDDADDAEDD